jgi:hypothetical protein
MALFIQYGLRNTIGDTLFFNFAIPDSGGKNELGILYGRDALFSKLMLATEKNIKKHAIAVWHPDVQ